MQYELKKQFEFYLYNCVKSNLKNKALGKSAVTSYLSYMEHHNLFGYNPTKWSHIQSIYSFTSSYEVSKILEQLSEDSKFVEWDKEKGSFASGALFYYICFLNAREYFSNTSKTISYNKTCRQYPLQQIYYGAPGTGKSHTVDLMCQQYEHFRTTFHPDSDYSTFVGCYKPITINRDVEEVNKHYTIDNLADILKDEYNKAGGEASEKSKTIAADTFAYEFCEYINGKFGKISIKELVEKAGLPKGYHVAINDSTNLARYHKMQNSKLRNEIAYKFVPQTFTKAYITAWQDTTKPVFLVIEEINRGNCAQIFGDLFQLLDRDENGFSKYEITPDTDLVNYIASQNLAVSGVTNSHGDDISTEIAEGTLMKLPPNLYIWATMNTSDQSLFPIDSAFKRRWDWKYVPIDTAKENWNIKVNNNNYSWTNFLDVINEKIFAKTDSEDKQLGFYFCKAEGNVISAEKFVGKVLFYIYNDVYKDYGFDEDFFIDKTDNKKLTFRSFYNFDGSINEGKVEAILKNLEIKKTDDDSDGNDKVGMSVQYNGQTVHEKNDLETYVKILELIGVDRIATLDIKCYDQNIVGVEPPGNYAWRTVNNYKVLTFKLHRHMERILNEIAAKLQIDLHVSFE